MITKLLRRIFGKPDAIAPVLAVDGVKVPMSAATTSATGRDPKKSTDKSRKRRGRSNDVQVVSVDEHGINPELISRNAVTVANTLQDAGYQAFIVGGAVRDLLLGIKPKDFDVATDATPPQVAALFRRARLIGRRFQIVHVTFYGGREQEVIEVSTFRAMVDAAESTQVTDKRSRRGELDQHQHATDASGRVLRDNVWGSQEEDAARRDFTVNAMYYDPRTQLVHDHHGGFDDLRAGVLRMIGDPATRYREDPIRILRAIRFAAKTGFSMAPTTAAPIATLGSLIHDVPDSRLFDEILKLLLSGHAWASLQALRTAGLGQGLLPMIDVILEQPEGEQFVRLALASTDARVLSGRPVSPGFLFAALLWHRVLRYWEANKAGGEAVIPALFAAMDTVLSSPSQRLAIQKRHVADMKEIWTMQPRFERRVGRLPQRLVELPRFRAGYDFLLLRCEAGEMPVELGQWWTDFYDADGDERDAMIEAVRTAGGADSGRPKNRRPRTRRKGKPSGQNSDTVTENTNLEESASEEYAGDRLS